MLSVLTPLLPLSYATQGSGIQLLHHRPLGEDVEVVGSGGWAC